MRKYRRLWDTNRFPALVQAPRCKGFSVIRRPALCTCIGGGKNGLRSLRHDRARVVRSQAALGAGFGVWRLSNLFGDRGASNRLLPMLEGEARETGVARGQSVLQQAICLLLRWDGAAGPRRSKTLPEETHLDLENHQRAGKAVMASNMMDRDSNSQGHWGGRNCHTQGTHLSHRCLVTFCAAARSGLGVRTVQNRAWMSSSHGWGRRKASKSGLR